ncbi:MAG: hypothetical protein ABIR38_03835, partial [Chthoniobacterales bacterium]
MKRLTPALLLAAAIAFFAGLVVGRYTAKVPTPLRKIALEPTEDFRKEALLPKVVARPVANPSTSGKAAVDVSSPDAIIAALRNAMARPNDRRGYREAGKLIDEMDPKNARAAIEALQGLPERREKSVYLAMLIGRWAEGDPQAAIAYAQTNGTPSDRRLTVSAAIRSWAEKDATAAGAFVLQMPD